MGTMLLITYSISLGFVAFFGLHKLFLVCLYMKYRNHQSALPEQPDSWPDVTIQLPIYNERFMVTRLLRAIAQIDYPHERVHIQVLDDSTDSTERLVSRLCTVLRSRGYDIDHIRRPERTGFKAGALDTGLCMTNADYIAVFDADFIPNPDFLTTTIPYLLQPGVGMVQTRWGHINRTTSFLTKIQALFLDGHFIIDHTARHFSGKFFNFNGTAGIWRRQAIINAGGWQHDTLTEDLDLSYRAQLKGWRFIFLPDIVSPAQLPEDINAFKNQQFRWSKGSAQTAIKLVPRIMRAPLPLLVRIESIIHLTDNLTYLMMVVSSIVFIPLLITGTFMSQIIFFLLFSTIVWGATLSIILYYIVTVRAATGSLWPGVLYIPVLMSIGIGLSVTNGRAVLEALLGTRSPFVRTPKNDLQRLKQTNRYRYSAVRTWNWAIELLFGIYFTAGMFYMLDAGFYYIMPFIVMFQFGYLYIAFGSLAHQTEP